MVLIILNLLKFVVCLFVQAKDQNKVYIYFAPMGFI